MKKELIKVLHLNISLINSQRLLYISKVVTHIQGYSFKVVLLITAVFTKILKICKENINI